MFALKIKRLAARPTQGVVNLIVDEQRHKGWPRDSKYFQVIDRERGGIFWEGLADSKREAIEETKKTRAYKYAIQQGHTITFVRK